MKSSIFPVVVFALLGTIAAWAQDPVVDGTVNSSEYQYVQSRDGMNLGAKLSADGKTLFLSVSAKTTGWVSVGTGSAKMDGAFMVIAYIAGGIPNYLYDLGKGHSHQATSPSGVTAKVVETAAGTTLEVSLPAAQYVKAGVADIIVAYGRQDEVRGRHAGRAAFKAKL
jgi:hypothetical protein